MISLYRPFKVALINSTLPTPYWSYGDHWHDGFIDAGCEVTVYKYDQIQTIPPGFDLYFFMDIRYNPVDIPWYLNPRVMYLFDMHTTGPDMYTPFELCYDAIYAGSKVDVDYLRSKGHYRFKWLPEACNPRIHKDLGQDRRFDIGFVGSTDNSKRRNGKTREDFVSYLNSSPKRTFSLVQGVYGEEYNETMNNFIVSFDRTISHNIGTRIFEASAMGCIPVWSKSEQGFNCGIEELFCDGMHYVSYDDSIEDLESKLDKIFDDPLYRKSIINNAKKNVLANHTYSNRVMHIINDLGLHHYSIKSNKD